MQPHLWDARATSVRSEGPDQRDGQESEKQSPEDIHQIVHYVGERTLQEKHKHTYVNDKQVHLMSQFLINTWGKKYKLYKNMFLLFCV